MIAQAGESFVNQWFDGYWLVLIMKAAIVLIFFLVAPLGVGYIEHKVLAHMQGRARADVRGPVPRLGAADGRRGQVRPEGGRDPRRGRLLGLLARAGGRARPVHPAVRRDPVLGHDLHPEPRRRHLLRAGDLVGLRDRRADGRLGLREQVLADRRAPSGRAADRLRAAAGAGGRRGRDAGGDALDGRHRRGAGAGTGSSSRSRSGSSSSSSPRSPSSRGRRSTCRSRTPRSSSAPTPSTRG